MTTADVPTVRVAYILDQKACYMHIEIRCPHTDAAESSQLPRRAPAPVLRACSFVQSVSYIDICLFAHLLRSRKRHLASPCGDASVVVRRARCRRLRAPIPRKPKKACPVRSGYRSKVVSLHAADARFRRNLAQSGTHWQCVVRCAWAARCASLRGRASTSLPPCTGRVAPSASACADAPCVPRARATVARFAEGGVVTPKEGWALLTRGGFTPVDVRTSDEHSYAVAGAASVPIISGTWRFDAATKKRAPTEQRRNDGFLRDVAKRFPDVSSPLLIHCSDGRSRSMSALRALEAVGYTRLAGLKGGYAAFAREFDAKLQPRHSDDIGRDPWREVDGNAAFADGQTTGLNHGSSFERMDNPGSAACPPPCAAHALMQRCLRTNIADNLFPMKDPVPWMAVEFTEAEVAEAKALLATSHAKAPQHAFVEPDTAPARPAAVPVAQAEAPPVERPAEPAAASDDAPAASRSSRGEARGEYVIFRF